MSPTASLSVLTLGVRDLSRSRAFYSKGFGWEAVFENEEILFYQLNGIVFGLWLAERMAEDLQRPSSPPGNVSLAHNVPQPDLVDLLVHRLLEAGGTLLRPPDSPPHGGRRGHVADPDGHAWEIAWNPAFAMDDTGNVTFGV